MAKRLPPALSLFLSASPTPTRSEPDKGNKAAAAVVVEASAKSRREDAEASAREWSEDAAADVAWLSKALEPTLQLYNWKPFTYVARKLADYAKIVTVSASSDVAARPPSSTEVLSADSKKDVFVPEDLFLRGTLYYLERDIDEINGGDDESCALWRGDAGENFQRIVLSGN